jgi:adenylyltransferase/sulfurtransferase
MFTPDELARFQRHFTLPEIGPTGQARLRSSAVLVVGAGGLGSPCLLYLAAAGVGRIRVVDPDRVDLSNLQRQIVHGVADIGRWKVESAADRLRALDPAVHVEAVQAALSPGNVHDLLLGCQLVIDATDDPAVRYTIDDACAQAGLPWVYASIHRLEGQICVFDPQTGPGYRDLFPVPPPPALAPSCASAGVLGALPGVLGAMQAARAVRVLLYGPGDLAGRLHLVDPWNMVFHEIRVQRGHRPIPAVQAPVVAWRRLSPRALAAVQPPPRTLDLREQVEIDADPCPFPAERCSPEVAGHQVDSPGPLLLVCQSGRRSSRVAAALVAAGRAGDLTWELDGGLRAWKAASADPTWEGWRRASPANPR